VRHTSPDASATTAGFEVGLDIKAPAGRVIRAFFDAAALGAWWGVSRSVTTPRPLGPYVLEWPPTEHRDDVLGRLGGVFRGTVMNFDPIAGFFVADAYYLPPDGDPIGPMALEVQARPHGNGRATMLTVRQSGEGEGPRWQRYFEIMGHGWEGALLELKDYMDREAQRTRRE
jgi:uncharacterized protein YndB with AHSA1/START domain